MNRVDNRFKPFWLPQVNAPFNHVVKNLSQRGMTWKPVKISAANLKPLQGLTNSEAVDNLIASIRKGEKLPPVFVAANNEILDGHHRYAAYLHSGSEDEENKVFCIKIMADYKDAARLLNQIQDIFDYEQQGASSLQPINRHQPKKYIAYRKAPIKENSKCGNFFYLKPNEQMIEEFTLEVDNCHCVEADQITNPRLPAESLAKAWFLKADLLAMASKHNLPYDTFINRLVAKSAVQKGFDAINYADKILQVVGEEATEGDDL